VRSVCRVYIRSTLGLAASTIARRDGAGLAPADQHKITRGIQLQALAHVVAQRLSMSNLVVQQLSGFIELQKPLTGFEKHLLHKYKELDVSLVAECSPESSGYHC
jgi:hypothetical protein